MRYSTPIGSQWLGSCVPAVLTTLVTLFATINSRSYLHQNNETYLCTEFVAYENAILDLNDSDYVPLVRLILLHLIFESIFSHSRRDLSIKLHLGRWLLVHCPCPLLLLLLLGLIIRVGGPHIPWVLGERVEIGLEATLNWLLLSFHIHF